MELRKGIMKQLRTNFTKERKHKKLDKKIELLISHKHHIQHMEKPKLKKNVKEEVDVGEKITNRHLRLYSQLLFLLQTKPIYLAKLANLITSKEMSEFQNTMIITLFGSAFSPREEFLILELFKKAIDLEVDYQDGDMSKFTEEHESSVPRMVLAYNNRKLGREYLVKAFSEVVLKTLENEAVSFEVNPLRIYSQLISEYEVKTGQKSEKKKGVSAEEAAKDPDVMKIIDERKTALVAACKTIFDTIRKKLSDMPYGLRVICKRIHDITLEKFPDTNENVVWKVSGYFVFYRFINLMIVQPDNYGVCERDLSINVRKNLVQISKVLQKVFNLGKFPRKNELFVLNEFIEETREDVLNYNRDLIDVEDPETFLQMNSFNALAQKTTPFVIISHKELVTIHSLFHKHKDEICSKKGGDPLKVIMDDLDVPPSSDDKEVQLYLENRFAPKVSDTVSVDQVYAMCVEDIVQLFRRLEIERMKASSLKDIIDTAGKLSNDDIVKLVSSINSHLTKLKKGGKIAEDDNTLTDLLKDVAMEVAHREERREAQMKEITRLKITLGSLEKHAAYLDKQVTEFDGYLQVLRKTIFEEKRKPKQGFFSFKKNTGTKKYSYRDLAKQGVILHSAVPSISRGKTRFFITAPQPGFFLVEAKISGISVGKLELELEDLLEKKENNKHELDLGQVTLDVNMTLYLINKEFLVTKVK